MQSHPGNPLKQITWEKKTLTETGSGTHGFGNADLGCYCFQKVTARDVTVRQKLVELRSNSASELPELIGVKLFQRTKTMIKRNPNITFF